MFFNNKFNTFFGLNLTLVYTFPICMAWRFHFPICNYDFKEGLPGVYRIWCGVNRLGDSGVHTRGDTSAFVNPAGQLLLTWRGKTRMDGVGIVFYFYI